MNMLTKSFDSGVGLLKILAALLVVNSHFGVENYFNFLAVPIFVFSSFMFFKVDMSIADLRCRIVKLGLPFVGWSMFYWVVDCLRHERLDWGLLAGQLLTGHAVCQPLYFMVLLILFTAILFFILRLRRSVSLFLLGLLVLVSLIITCSGSHLLLNSVLPDSISYARWTCGRFFELFPYAGLAVFMRTFFRDKGWIVIVISSIGFIVCRMFEVKHGGFMYNGVDKIFATVAIFFCFNTFNRTLNGAAGIIRVLQSLSIDVYYVHMAIGAALSCIFDFSCYVRFVLVSIFSFLVAYIAFVLKKQICNLIREDRNCMAH